MDYENAVRLEIKSLSKNEAFARVAVAAFVSQLDPTVNDITDIKTAVSEAVTNAIIHGYEDGDGTVFIECKYNGKTVYVDVWDDGVGIDDINKAREPLYTSKPHMERSGMGFTVMETFMDTVEVESYPGKGTRIHMIKELEYPAQ